MGLFDTLLGVGKLASNFLGGGSGETTKTSGTGTTTTSGKETTTSKGQTTANRREYSDGFLSILEPAAANTLVGSSQSNDALARRTQEVAAQPEFDAAAYVRDVMANADRTIGQSLTQNRNRMVADAGGSAGSNSASAILAARLEGDAAAQRAGVYGDAVARGEEIRSNSAQSKTGQLVNLDTSMSSSLATLLNGLRGGETYQVVTDDQTSTTNMSSTGTTTQNQTSRTPFNWTKGLGNLFADIDQDK